MKELFESLAENVSEACYNDIIGIIEELISEVNVPDETVAKILNRKANQVGRNQAERGYHLQMVANTRNEGEWHKDNPDATTQDRINYASKHAAAASKKEAQGDKIKRGAARIANWVYKKGTKSKEVADSYKRLGNTIKRSNIENAENPV